MAIIRKPKGIIKLTSRHRSPKGKLFKEGEEYEFYAIVERRECSTCNGKKGKLMYKLYQTKDGLIPVNKAKII